MNPHDMNPHNKNFTKVYRVYWTFHVTRWSEDRLTLLEFHKITVQRQREDTAKDVVCSKYPPRDGYFCELNNVRATRKGYTKDKQNHTRP